MSNLNMRDKLRAESGVCGFLLKKGLVETPRRGQLDRVICEFLAEHNLPIEKYNKRYKGNYDALNINCQTVQENWTAFHIWVREKISKNNLLTVG